MEAFSKMELLCPDSRVPRDHQGANTDATPRCIKPMDYIAMEEAVFIGLTENRKMKDLREIENFTSLQIHVFRLHSPVTLNRELFFLFKLTANHRHQRRPAFKSENMSSALTWLPVFGGGW
ncbi:uncharacterized protein LOC144236795 [Crocuta crocuta]